MNEVLIHKQVKKIISYGIHKSMAKQIVKEVAEIVGTHDVTQFEYAIGYAVSISHRIDFSHLMSNAK